MDETPKKPTEEEVRKKLDKALDTEPGLAKAVVKEGLKRGDEMLKEDKAGKSPMPENEPPEKPQRQFSIKVHEQTIKLDNVIQAEKLRVACAQQEGDAIIHGDNGWVYVRRRTMVEETNVEPSNAHTDKSGPEADPTPSTS